VGGTAGPERGPGQESQELHAHPGKASRYGTGDRGRRENAAAQGCRQDGHGNNPDVPRRTTGRRATHAASVARRFFRAAFGAFVNFAKGRPPLARYEQTPRHVIEAKYMGDYKVWLEFNDGRKGVVDLADELHGESLEPLRDRSHFSQFYLDYGLSSIAWLSGQDFAPEFLYEKLKAMN
jgi:hypothetical protein